MDLDQIRFLRTWYFAFLDLYVLWFHTLLWSLLDGKELFYARHLPVFYWFYAKDYDSTVSPKSESGLLGPKLVIQWPRLAGTGRQISAFWISYFDTELIKELDIEKKHENVVLVLGILCKMFSDYYLDYAYCFTVESMPTVIRQRRDIRAEILNS